MKHLSWLILLISNIAMAQQTITLQPGSHITIDPAVRTEVICAQSSQSESFCKCDYTPRNGWMLKKIMISNGNRQEEVLSYFGSDSAACERRLADHPACR